MSPGLTKYDNGTLYQHRLQQAVGPHQSHAASSSSALSVTANLNYIHNIDAPRHHRQRQHRDQPVRRLLLHAGVRQPAEEEPGRVVAAQPVRTGQSRLRMPPRSTRRSRRAGSLAGARQLDAVEDGHQSLQFTAIGGADLASRPTLLYAPPDLQVEQRIPSGLPGHVGLEHRADQLLQLRAQPDPPLHRALVARRDDVDRLQARPAEQHQPGDRMGYNLLAGVNAPTVGTTQLNYFYRTAQLDQSFYAQRAVALLLNQRLTVNGGVTAERSTNDGDINKFYYYPHYSASYRLPAVRRLLSTRSSCARPTASRATWRRTARSTSPLPVCFDRRAGGIGQQPAPRAIRTSSRNPRWRPSSGFDATMFHSRAQFYGHASIRSGCRASCCRRVSRRRTGTLTYTSTADSSRTGHGVVAPGDAGAAAERLHVERHGLGIRNYSLVDALPVPPFGACSGGWCYGCFFAVGRSVTELVNTSFTGPSGLPVQNGDTSAGLLTSLGNEFTWKGFRVYGLLDWSRGGNTSNSTDFYFDGLGRTSPPTR